MASILSLGILYLYRPLLPLLAHLAGAHLILFVTIFIPFLLVYGVVGRDYGIHRLFWHEFPRRRLVAAFSLTLLVVNFVAVGYYTSIRPEDRVALGHLAGGLTDLATSWKSFDVDLLRVASWADSRRVADFQQEEFGRLLVFLMVAVPPPLLILSMPAFFPGLVRLSARGLPPRRRLVDVASWFGGIALGLSTAVVLVVIGHWIYSTLARGRFGEGERGEEVRKNLQEIRELITLAEPDKLPSEEAWASFEGRLKVVREFFVESLGGEDDKGRLEAQARVARGFQGEHLIDEAVRAIDEQRKTRLVAELATERGMDADAFTRLARRPRRGEARSSMDAPSGKGQATGREIGVGTPRPLAWDKAGKEKLRVIGRELGEVRGAIRQLTEDRTSGLIVRWATLSFLIVGTGFLFAFALVPFLYDFVTSAFAICLIFSFLATTSAAFICFVTGEGAWTIVVITALVIVITLSNSNRFKFKFPTIERFYGLTPLTSLESALEIPPPIDYRTNDDEALDAWARSLAGAGDGNRRLVVVAVSGGATRSAIWTAIVLGELCRKIPGFARHIRIISGASGGMVGAAYFVKALMEYRRATGDTDYRRVPAWNVESIINRDSLDTVAKHLALRDGPSILFPWSQSEDRGRALEETWRWPEPWGGQPESTAGPGRKDPGLVIPFSDLAGDELAGAIPSMIFSPMLVEDGRRLLISNLDLPFMTVATADALTDPKTTEAYGRRLSTSAVELRTLLGKEARDRFRVSTAVRMSASFPYVSPAVKLPTEPSRRVVDAGYYDNYGISVAASWLYHHRDHLRRVAPDGVVLVQVRDQISKESRLGAGSVVGSPVARRLSEAFSFLTSPLAGAAAARLASTSFRNDEGLMILSDLLNGDGDAFFTTVSFEAGADVAVSWALSDDEVSLLKGQLRSRPVDGVEQNSNVARLDQLVDWWARGPVPNTPSHPKDPAGLGSPSMQ